MKTSCGVIIINEYNELFMAHSTGNKFFDIPKGLLDEGETPIDCAIRECQEETSIILFPSELKDLGVFKYNKEKDLHLFLCFKDKADIDLNTLVCQSFFENFYTKKMQPEADGFEWKSLDSLTENCAKSMGKLLNKMKEDGLLNRSHSLKPLA